jgi:hypothetical protein
LQLLLLADNDDEDDDDDGRLVESVVVVVTGCGGGGEKVGPSSAMFRNKLLSSGEKVPVPESRCLDQRNLAPNSVVARLHSGWHVSCRLVVEPGGRNVLLRRPSKKIPICIRAQ